MIDHPTPAALRAFLAGTLPRDQANSVVAHLLAGCAPCNAAVAPAVLVAGGRDTVVLPELDARETSGYDAAIERALSAVRLHGVRLPEIRKKSARVLALLQKKGLAGMSVVRQGPLPVYEALLAHGETFRHSNPQKMVEHALFAVHIARHLDKQGLTPEQIADLQARALGEFANAFRVTDQLEDAERYMAQAFEQLAAGSGDLLLGLRLEDLRASLLMAQHRYAETVPLLSEVVERQLRLGDRHAAARALINKAICLGYLGEPEITLRLLDRAAALVDETQEPGLKATAFHNKLLFLVGLSRWTEALMLLDQNRPLLRHHGGRLGNWKLLDIEGRIQAGLGHLDAAEASFRHAKEGFAKASTHGHEAVVALDLAAVVMRQGRQQEGLRLTAEALQEFLRLRIGDQIAEALLVLADAILERLTTATLVQSVADFIRRAEHDPRARFEPRFE